MCVVSMIMDHYGDKWQRRIDFPPLRSSPIGQSEVDEFKELLRRAREYDKRMNQPDCELEKKRERIRGLAKELGVEVAFV